MRFDRMRTIFWLGTGLAAGMALAWGVSSTDRLTEGGATAIAETPPPARVAPVSQAQVQLSYAPVVQKAAPAVVNIYTRKIVRQSPMMSDPFFRFFFGDRAGAGAGRERVQSALGSGVIVRADGLIVSNRHVVGDADEIQVVLADRREFEGKVVFQDPRSDLALVRIEPRGAALPVIRLGDSDRLQVGDIALAIGNPFGVGQTVTQGIVSAVRSGGGPTDYQYYIQTDAAINPGNSGGALVGMNGELIGINTFIASPTGGSVGVGFAVPVNLVRAILPAATTGKVVRPWLGLEGQAIDADLAATLNLDRPRGVLVNRLNAGSPAATAGLKPGDVITAIDGQPVDDIETLQFRIATKAVGTRAALTVIRDGKSFNLPIALIAPPENPPRGLTWLDGQHAFAGVRVGNLSPAYAQELGGGLPDRGVVVVELKPASPAARLGLLQPGDVLEAINGKPVTTVAQAQAQLKGSAGAMSYRFLRGGRLAECAIRPPAYISCRQ